ncbi:MAG: PhoH family protein [Deltaproteobacteria bacterium]|nr:PhoH family protein [Deltaproteobacteria bacterium]
MPRKKKSTFILDTNVILHDSACIYHFGENNVVIPVTVLEELDQFKKGSEILNYHAREFVRTLDLLCGEHMFNGGVPIGPGLGKITVKLDRKFHEDLVLSFSESRPDHHVLNIAYHLARENPSLQVILVTKDVNLRIKAKSVGLVAQDYKSDQIKDITTLYTGKRLVENIPGMVLQKLYEPPFELEPSDLSLEKEPVANEYFILRNGNKSVLGTYDPLNLKIRRIDKNPAFGIMPRNAEQTFALDALTNNKIQLLTLSGKAGTGKTLLALAAALQRKKNYRQIFLARPVVPLSNKDLGFLPGDIQSKLDPYMQPLFDNLSVIKSHFGKCESSRDDVNKLLEENKLLISALAYIRGRSLVNIYFIVDEAQNLTPHEVKTIITRAGENTKIVFTGDIFQIDHPYLNTQSNGLSYLIEKMHGQKLYAHINLEKGERSELSELASNLL